MEESNELFDELADNSIEMDAMSEIEKEILDMFDKEKANNSENAELTEKAIMAGVGVEAGIPEVEVDEEKLVQEEARGALAKAEAQLKAAEEQLKASPTAAQLKVQPSPTQERNVPEEGQAKANTVEGQVADALAQAQAEAKLVEEHVKRAAKETQKVVPPAEQSPKAPGKDE